jgi:SAM-dependent methyltransferase
MIPDWQLPAGVDRGLWDYLHSRDMAQGYDAMMMVSPLAEFDVRFCIEHLQPPGRILDLGCGTGRLAHALEGKGYEYVGLDLSDEMLAVARRHESEKARFVLGNLLHLNEAVQPPFDHAACLFSTYGMIRGDSERKQFLRDVFGLLRPGGRFVLHVHNRRFLGLGLKRWGKRELTMPQAYGGAPLTLTHFTRTEAIGLLKDAGFVVEEVLALNTRGPLPLGGWATGLRAYGYLAAALKPL